MTDIKNYFSIIFKGLITANIICLFLFPFSYSSTTKMEHLVTSSLAVENMAILAIFHKLYKKQENNDISN